MDNQEYQTRRFTPQKMREIENRLQESVKDEFRKYRQAKTACWAAAQNIILD